ncbi:salicylate hydroxylase [Penicillium cataractarum]|uniref:Salicylate hydroxylase n=1 Tax=Penicillium cataractarum TaxID=2100454 RepID=A0A9W9USB2_9EURO|nr:salicylate hydroxylase [Penicillium cataractarum]KAJ5355512.1 salicylate hydroxylase [Penicillium cataractarum]
MGEAESHTGFGYLRIKRADLVDVHLEGARAASIPIRFNTRVIRMEERDESAKVKFSDGTEDTADMIFGCDGIHSYVRSALFDPQPAPKYSGIATLMSTVPVSELSLETRSQIIGIEATVLTGGVLKFTPCTAAEDEIFWGISRQVALPNSDGGHLGWQVHGESETEALKSSLLENLHESRGAWGDAMREVIQKSPTLEFYPIHRLPIRKPWFNGRCHLLGDAAHPMPPHASQGVLMGMEDAFLLSRLLEDPHRPLDEVYEKFEEIRRPRVNEIYAHAAWHTTLRKRSSALNLREKELNIAMSMSLSWALGQDKWRSKQSYDIDGVEITPTAH